MPLSSITNLYDTPSVVVKKISDTSGVAVPTPMCPMVVGANGPRMAELAGRLADGVNFHSSEPALEEVGLRVVVAGEGPDRPMLERRIADEQVPVELLGARDDVPDLLAAADLVISTARWEGQPISLQEALHAGAAIVATDVGGTAAVVGDAAVLVPGGDARALADGIRTLVTDPQERARRRELSRERAHTLPTEADAVAAALEIYERVAGAR